MATINAEKTLNMLSSIVRRKVKTMKVNETKNEIIVTKAEYTFIKEFGEDKFRCIGLELTPAAWWK